MHLPRATIVALTAVLTLLCLAGVGGMPAAKAPTGDLENLLWRAGEAPPRIDARGGTLAAETLRDRLAVVSFVSADCTILCAVRTMSLDKLSRDLPEGLRGRVVFLAIDTDPDADDAARLLAFADGLVGPATRLRFLTSDAAGLRAVTEALRYPTASLPEPPSSVLLFDRRGRIAMTYGGDRLDVPRLQRDLVALDTFTQGLGRSPTETDPPR